MIVMIVMIITIILMINMGRSWELGVCDRPTERSRLSRLKSRGATIIITNDIIIIMFAYMVFFFISWQLFQCYLHKVFSVWFDFDQCYQSFLVVFFWCWALFILREEWRYQIGWFFGKIQNSPWPPLIFGKLILQFFITEMFAYIYARRYDGWIVWNAYT